MTALIYTNTLTDCNTTPISKYKLIHLLNTQLIKKTAQCRFFPIGTDQNRFEHVLENRILFVVKKKYLMAQIGSIMKCNTFIIVPIGEYFHP